MGEDIRDNPSHNSRHSVRDDFPPHFAVTLFDDLQPLSVFLLRFGHRTDALRQFFHGDRQRVNLIHGLFQSFKPLVLSVIRLVHTPDELVVFGAADCVTLIIQNKRSFSTYNFILYHDRIIPEKKHVES